MSKMQEVVRILQEEQAKLSKQLQGITAALTAFGNVYKNGTQSRGKISAAGRARIAAAQRARWAKAKGSVGKVNVVTMPKKRVMSAAARKRIAAAQRARWAKVKAKKAS
jgi:hypothetical protein